MTLVICDSSFIILIAKLEILDLLIKAFEHIMIPKAVYFEAVVHGKKLGKIDAFFIEKRIKDGKITVENIKDLKEQVNISKNFKIHEGEAEALVLYLEKKAELLGTDDYKTLKVCKILNIRYFTTLLFIYRCYSNNFLSKDVAILKYEKLQEFGWYKEALVEEFRKKIEKKGGIESGKSNFSKN